MIPRLFGGARLVFKQNKMPISKRNFGSFDGHDVTLYELSNDHGVTIEILDYGGCLRSWKIPCKSGKVVDILLGYDKFEGKN